MTAGWSTAAIACLAVLVCFGGYILALVIANAIRAYRNDRRRDRARTVTASDWLPVQDQP